MNSQTSRKIIVASVMAVVVGIGIVTFALSSHPVVSVAPTPHPSTSVTQVPAADLRAAAMLAAPPPIAEIPDDLASIAQVPDAVTADAHHDKARTNNATPSAAERRLARKQHLTKANASAVAPVKSADELTTTPASSSSTGDQKVATSTELAPSDSPNPPK